MAVLHIDGRGPVLILVLVDVGLGLLEKADINFQEKVVLILVLVDVGLGLIVGNLKYPALTSLNPCFSGCWSRTHDKVHLLSQPGVLILVLVDVGLGPCL